MLNQDELTELAKAASLLLRQGLALDGVECDLVAHKCPYQASDIAMYSFPQEIVQTDAAQTAVNRFWVSLKPAVDHMLNVICARRHVATQHFQSGRPSFGADTPWACSSDGGVWVGIVGGYDVYRDEFKFKLWVDYDFSPITLAAPDVSASGIGVGKPKVGPPEVHEEAGVAPKMPEKEAA